MGNDDLKDAIERYFEDGGAVSILPAGKAEGADDLAEWGRRRQRGWSGVYEKKKKPEKKAPPPSPKVDPLDAIIGPMKK